ncbi:hypothetical protein HBI70_226730 [Parastagonospora nodorum]|nr:hypothetical protein HBH46_207330 [Parastagonospora nodorum]KAH4401478.1 hypothetical protein HBH92_223020 [Parastagonospora nodorum]KAH4430855.1 hypothetical protein HBH91_233330 [Parastagonospora nodorum]KAH4439041.1 hypothetical protein HBH93_088260 [Parastagonospora nodorum]KAH4486351.1 hypothetical protein HBH89_207980 [Parastagonospora nodorum]
MRVSATTFAYLTVGTIARVLLASDTTVTAAGIKWDDAVKSGANLFFGMQTDDRKASFFFKTDPYVQDPTIQTVQSSHDGDMKEEFIKWGYNEDEAQNAKIDKECDFEAYHRMKRAFDELGINTASKANGGPNQCVQLDHRDGATVVRDKDNKLPPTDEQRYIDESCGKEYRETGGTFQFGINGQDGLVALINVISPAYSANRLWQRKPSSDELPQIRSISDVAWGFWNRAGNIQGIKYFLVTMILNEDTRNIIRQAHETLEPKRSETAIWPGFEFRTDTPAVKAILGSPVARWAGYFLMQHKKQLGENKYISKLRVFKPDVGSLPNILFYVETAPPIKPGSRAREVGLRGSSAIVSQIAKHDIDSKNVVREHIFRVYS